jgi:hypothetical protein
MTTIPAEVLKQIEEAAERHREKTGWDMSEGNDVRRAFYEGAKQFYLAGLNQNQRKIEVMREAIEDVRLQFYGIKNNWCGQWFICTECKTIYAKGGNWTVTKQSDEQGKCHFCRLLDVLEQTKDE